jgi:hypothetical protein
MTPLRQWMRVASDSLHDTLARAAGTSVAYLYALAAEATDRYRRNASVELAAKIEAATMNLSRKSRGALPVVYRTDLNRDCAACPYARKCLGPLAVRADFPEENVK